MKIRWTQNSVRLRISPSELNALEEGENVVERLCVISQVAWIAKIAPRSEQTALVWEAGGVCFCLSGGDLLQLAAPDSEGVYFAEGDLRYYIEKDFPCVHPRAAEAQETPTETFAPPSDFSERKA